MVGCSLSEEIYISTNVLNSAHILTLAHSFHSSFPKAFWKKKKKKTYVCHLFSVQYALHLYCYFREWRKNPHCSSSCCLGLLIPLNDLQGDVRGLAEANVLKTQIDTGDFEMVTLQAAVIDSGAIDVTLEEGEEDDDDTVEVQGNSRQGAMPSDQKCDQGSQTEFFSIFTKADVALHQPFYETHL